MWPDCLSSRKLSASQAESLIIPAPVDTGTHIQTYLFCYYFSILNILFSLALACIFCLKKSNQPTNPTKLQYPETCLT